MVASTRWEQLIALIGRLPPDKAEKLRSLLASQDFGTAVSDGFAEMMTALALRSGDAGSQAPEALMRRVCKLLEPFLVNTVEVDEAEGTVARPSLAIWWAAAKAQMPIVAEWEQKFTQALGKKDDAEAQEIADAATVELAKQALKLTAKGASAQVNSDIKRIAAILSGGPSLRRALNALGLEGQVTHKNRLPLAGALEERFALEYGNAMASGEFNPIWLGHAAMNRLERPWQVLALIHKVQVMHAKGVKLEETDLAPLVQRNVELLRSLSIQSVNSIKEAAKSRKAEDMQRAGTWSTSYFDASEMFADQLKIERDSAWGRTYFTLRKTLYELIDAKLPEYEDILVEFIEEWDEATQLEADNAKFSQALAAAALLGIWRGRAERHGFSTSFSALERRLRALISRSLGQSEEGKSAWRLQKKQLLQVLRMD